MVPLLTKAVRVHEGWVLFYGSELMARIVSFGKEKSPSPGSTE